MRRALLACTTSLVRCRIAAMLSYIRCLAILLTCAIGGSLMYQHAVPRAQVPAQVPALVPHGARHASGAGDQHGWEDAGIGHEFLDRSPALDTLRGTQLHSGLQHQRDLPSLSSQRFPAGRLMAPWHPADVGGPQPPVVAWPPASGLRSVGSPSLPAIRDPMAWDPGQLRSAVSFLHACPAHEAAGDGLRGR